MPSSLTCQIPLPTDYRIEDCLSFHRRDREEGSERVRGTMLEMGLMWHSAPAHLVLTFASNHLDASLSGSSSLSEADQPALSALICRMSGLDQPVAAFEARYGTHPQLGPLLRRQGGLRVPLTTTPFEAVVWAITGQQISVPVAVSLRRKFIGHYAQHNSQGLLCHPTPTQVAETPTEALRALGFAARKAQTILTVARHVAEGSLPLSPPASPAEVTQSLVDDVAARLLAIKGIGPWTISYTLLRGYGWLDGSLHGDVAVQRGLQALWTQTEKPTAEQTRIWLAPFSPWRALVAAHLWASLSQTAY